MQVGVITTAYGNGVPDEDIVAHTRHGSPPTMRVYIWRGKLGMKSPAAKHGLWPR
jgi:hypothetical protein